MTPRPKRAFFSLKSLLVMCAVLAAFVWANVTDRKPPNHPVHRRGVPWTHLTRIKFRPDPDYFVVRTADGTFTTLPMPQTGKPAVAVGRDLNVPVLVLNVLFALMVAFSTALASERFVFSRMRRGREGEKAIP